MTSQPEPWDDMVAAAVQGTARRPADPAQWPPPLGPMAARLAGDPAIRLLDAAAAATTLRRAGTPAMMTGAVASLAPPETRPAVSAAVTALIEDVPTLHTRFAEPLILEVARRTSISGRRFAFESLPFLLGAAAGGIRLRERIMAATGERGPWLAAHNPAWRRLVDLPGSPTGPDREWPPARGPEWSGLRVAERAHALQVWASDPDHSTSAVLDSLLEVALDDASKDVAALARALLQDRERSQFAKRATGRVHVTLTLRRGLLHSTIEVRPPSQVSPADVRDGFRVETPSTVAQRAYVAKVIADAPLTAFDAYGGPAMLDSRIDENWVDLVHGSLVSRIARAPREDWVRALARRDPAQIAPGLAELAPHLREPELIRAARGLLSLACDQRNINSRMPVAAASNLSRIPHPWPGVVTKDVTASLSKIADVAGAVAASDLLVGMVLGEPVDRLDDIADAVPDLPGHGSDLSSVHRVVKHRHTIERELPA